MKRQRYVVSFLFRELSLLTSRYLLLLFASFFLFLFSVPNTLLSSPLFSENDHLPRYGSSTKMVSPFVKVEDLNTTSDHHSILNNYSFGAMIFTKGRLDKIAHQIDSIKQNSLSVPVFVAELTKPLLFPFQSELSLNLSKQLETVQQDTLMQRLGIYHAQLFLSAGIELVNINLSEPVASAKTNRAFLIYLTTIHKAGIEVSFEQISVPFLNQYIMENGWQGIAMLNRKLISCTTLFHIFHSLLME